MDEVPLEIIIFIIVFLLFSAFLASAEMAFSIANKIWLRKSSEEEEKINKKALYIAKNIDKAMTTLLIGKYLANISAAVLFATVIGIASDSFLGQLISIVLSVLIIVIFSEVIPKSLVTGFAFSYSNKIAWFVYFFIRLLSPITFLLLKLKAFFVKLVSKNKQLTPSVTEEEIKVLVDLSEREGVINKSERELLHRSLEFNEILVGEILTHRLDMVAIEVDQPIEEIKELLLEERYSRIPVYEDNIDNIIGFLSEREFFAELVQNKEVDIRKLLRKPVFVVKSMKISTLLPELQRTKSHMAIVLDEFGGTAGLITMEDILEELVGEIWDEHDEKVNTITKVSENVYEFDAQFHLEDFAEALQIKVPESTYYNIGGWLFELLSRIPKEGETIQYENLKITMLEVDNHRLQKVRVEILEDENLEEKEEK